MKNEKLFIVALMVNREYIVIFVTIYASNDFYKNHLKSQTHTNNKRKRENQQAYKNESRSHMYPPNGSGSCKFFLIPSTTKKIKFVIQMI